MRPHTRARARAQVRKDYAADMKSSDVARQQKGVIYTHVYIYTYIYIYIDIYVFVS